jgi:hypothetical protein
MTPEIKYLVDKINDELTRFEQDMALGNAKDFGDYKYSCGIYRGLLMTKGFIQDLMERINNDEDNDD